MMKTPKLLLLGPGIALLLALLIFRVMSGRNAPPTPPTPLSEDPRILKASRLPLKRPDIAIGPIAAGSAPAKIKTLLGAPPSVVAEAPYHDEITEKDLPLESWRYDGLSVYILEGRVAQITANSPRWPSGKGLRTGDGLERVLELHGAPDAVRDESLVYCWEPGGTGFCPLTITLGPGRTVEAISYDAWPD